LRSPAGWNSLLTVSQTDQKSRSISPKASLSTTCLPIEEKLSQLPKPAKTLYSLDLDMSLVAGHRQAQVVSRLALFSHNSEKLTKNPWILNTVKVYRLPLQQWPSPRQTPGQFTPDQLQVEALATKISGLTAKGAVIPVHKSLVHLVNPLFVVPKSGGGWRPIIDLRHQNQFLSPPHFKMEGLYMMPSFLQREAFLVKIDLKMHS